MLSSSPSAAGPPAIATASVARAPDGSRYTPGWTTAPVTSTQHSAVVVVVDENGRTDTPPDEAWEDEEAWAPDAPRPPRTTSTTMTTIRATTTPTTSRTGSTPNRLAR